MKRRVYFWLITPALPLNLLLSGALTFYACLLSQSTIGMKSFIKKIVFSKFDFLTAFKREIERPITTNFYVFMIG